MVLFYTSSLHPAATLALLEGFTKSTRNQYFNILKAGFICITRDFFNQVICKLNIAKKKLR